ncbi:MAG: polyhydroxyalkanoate synthase [Janthinobacterium sp.]|jgi:polyhydroxyalkanoate synthase
MKQAPLSHLLKDTPAALAGAHLETVVPGWYDIEAPTDLDRVAHAAMGYATRGISPVSLALAYADWAFHLMNSPGKWGKLMEKAIRKESVLVAYAARKSIDGSCAPCIEPLPQDRRFRDPGWQRWPFCLIYQSFLLNQQWWHNATTGIGGVSKHHEQVVAFVARQLLDIVSPVNFIASNPEVLEVTAQENGKNFLRGAVNLLDDIERKIARRPPPGAEAFQPGRQVAITPGQVIYRNRLIELIQYSPQTDQVYAEPILIVPAWIMKYYILDLSKENSLVSYLVQRGHTVFMISWHNPDADDRDLSMEDYLQLGIFDAIAAVQAILPDRKINAVGYCLGGTLLAIAAAYLANQDGGPLKSVTLLAAQTDFSEAGELSLFIDESQIDFLENLMWRQGYLDTRQMTGAFQLLRSNDLIWSRIVDEYLLGKRDAMTDLMAWNADTTRMPYRMHSEYLRRLFLNNDLFKGRYRVHGKPAVLSDIHVPIFAVATETDHVAPWHSVYKLNLVADTELTFLLTSGGHNAGIISEPGHRHRRFRMSRFLADDRYVDPDRWYLDTPATDGSWWPIWADWLRDNSSAKKDVPPAIGAPQAGYCALDQAPGTYVHEK